MSSVKGLLQGNLVDGTGTAGYVPKWTGANTITTGAIYDNGTNVGIGTSSPNWKLDLNTSSALAGFFASSNSEATVLGVNNSSTGDPQLKFYLNGIGKYTLGVDNADGDKFKIGTTDIDINPRIVIDSSGNVGIRTSSPDADLQVGSNGYVKIDSANSATPGSLKLGYDSDYSEILVSNFGGNLVLRADASNTKGGSYMMFDVDGSERMRITSAGNVGIGTTNADKKFTIADANTSVRFYGSGNDFVLADPISSLNRNVIFNNSGSGGLNVLIGTTSSDVGYANGSGIALKSNGQISFARSGASENAFIQRDTVGRFFSFYYGNLNSTPSGVGQIETNGTSVSYTTFSDYRLKENVVEMTGALDRVDALKPSRFNFIADPESTVDGFLAHEVQDIVPEAITGEKDAVDEEGNPIYQGIDQSKLVPLLTAAIQELRAEIETLKSQING